MPAAPTTPPAPKKALATAQPATAPADVPTDAIETLFAELATSGDLNAAFTPLLSGLEGALNGASSYEEFTAALAPALANMDADKMAELLGRAMFQAHVAGELEADLEDGD